MSSTKDKLSVRTKNNRRTSYIKPHMIIPIEDTTWALSQKPSITKLWLECWRCDPYGSRWMPLTTNLVNKTLKQAKAELRNRNLFDFKSEMRMLEGQRFYETYVINLHGSRRKEFWKGGVIEDPTSTQEGENNPAWESQLSQIESSITPGGVIKNPTSSIQTHTQQGSQKASVTSHKRLSNSSKELLGRGEDTSQCSNRESEKRSLTPEEAIRHVEGVKQGNMPGKEIIELLREYPGQWAEFVHYAQVNKWDLSKEIPKVSNAASEMIEQIKAKKRKQRFQIEY